MLKESQISDLINQSGRLRMLSHRASMLLAQIGAGIDDSWFREELAISIDKFDRGYAHVQSTLKQDSITNGEFQSLIAHADLGCRSIKSTISQFLQGINQYQAAINRSKLCSSAELSEFFKFVATDLLVALNAIVSFFEGKLNDLATTKMKNVATLAKDVEESIDEVDQINLSVKILSFNASVEAARAGDVGRGFAVVSKEMNNLSSNTRLVTQKIKDTISAFVEELHR